MSAAAPFPATWSLEPLGAAQQPARSVATPPIAITCNLRELRGERSLQQVTDKTGIHRGTLSRVERALQFPTGQQAAALTGFYGQPIVYTLTLVVTGDPA